MMNALLVIAVFLLGLNGLMWFHQPSMVFFPAPELDAAPSNWGLEYEDVRFTTTDGLSLHGWYVPHAEAKRTVLFLHGNAGNISHRGESIAIFHRLGLNVLIFDYRGYGQSQGRPSETGLYRDADAAWRYLTESRGTKDSDIVVFGRSLGGIVAARLASEVHPRAVILESTFSSARDFARGAFPLMSRFVYQRFDFDAVAYIRLATAPLLEIHSPKDEIIPFELGRKVYEAAREPKTFLEISGDHNDGFMNSQPGYERSLAAYIDDL
jgi:fermentation-respiration switch protein FrsA (DUF1100 family)